MAQSTSKRKQPVAHRMATRAAPLCEGVAPREVHDRPVFVLAPPRSFSSVVATMLGQHPQLYGLPELELFAAETVSEWWRLCGAASYPRAHGTLRAVAELFFGGQTAETVTLARGWLRRRGAFTTGYLLESLAARAAPRIVVDKSTTNVYRLQFLRRISAMFPNARFIHLVRHPRSHGESVLKFLREREKEGPVPPPHWLRRLAAWPHARGGKSVTADDIDPQRAWYALHSNICKFLETQPPEQWLCVRAEDVLTDPDRHLRAIAQWLRVGADDAAVEEMKHPERSPYACSGPPGARFGNDRLFLENPVLPLPRAETQSLEGPLSWRPEGLFPKVKRLAQELGYE